MSIDITVDTFEYTIGDDVASVTVYREVLTSVPDEFELQDDVFENS